MEVSWLLGTEMTGKNLAVGQRESKREPMLRGGKRESTDKGSRKEDEKAAYINRGEMSPFVFLVASPPLLPHPTPWFASYRPIFSDIFKRKVASFLFLKFSMSFIRNGAYIYNQFDPLFPIWH